MEERISVNNLYVINAHGTRMYKVGITDQAVEQRLANLQTGNHLRLVIVRVYRGLGVRHVEAEVHRLLARYRVRSDGEWFELESPAMVDQALARLGHKRPWWSALPTGNIPNLLYFLLRMLIVGIFSNPSTQARAKLGKTYQERR